jgi:hypothetical protein
VLVEDISLVEEWKEEIVGAVGVVGVGSGNRNANSRDERDPGRLPNIGTVFLGWHSELSAETARLRVRGMRGCA